MKWMFPFQKVPRDSRVILYGGGAVGQTYLYQLKLTQYVKVVCIADKNYQSLAEFDIPTCAPENISQFSFDYIVIAIQSGKVAEDVRNLLHEKLGIDDKEIIFSIQYPPTDIPQKYRYKPLPVGKEYAYNQAENLSFAIHVSGGVGDFVVAKRMLDEILSWSDSLVVDVFCKSSDWDKAGFMRGLLNDTPKINIVASEASYPVKGEYYAAEFQFSEDCTVLHYHSEAFINEPLLLRRIESIERENQRYGYLIDGVLRIIYFARCEKDGLWRYTAYNRYDGFDVKDYHTKIPLALAFADQAKALCSGSYITITYGWGGPKIPNAKVWPKKYDEQFVRMFHQAYPDIKVVQVGAKGFSRIEGCDTYALGYDLEVAKYVLKDSLLHIDCEGGLVHLATQLGTKCVVLFGQTPIKFYAYPDNINLSAGCCHNCYWLTNDFTTCYRGQSEPECMRAITPEMVMEAVRRYLDTQGLDSKGQ